MSFRSIIDNCSSVELQVDEWAAVLEDRIHYGTLHSVFVCKNSFEQLHFLNVKLQCKYNKF